MAAMVPLLVMGYVALQGIECFFGSAAREQSARHDLRMMLRNIERTLIWQVQTMGQSTIIRQVPHEVFPMTASLSSGQESSGIDVYELIFGLRIMSSFLQLTFCR